MVGGTTGGGTLVERYTDAGGTTGVGVGSPGLCRPGAGLYYRPPDAGNWRQQRPATVPAKTMRFTQLSSGYGRLQTPPCSVSARLVEP